MHWLAAEPERFSDVPGAWSSDVEGVRVQLKSDEQLMVNGKPVGSEYRFDDIDEHGARASFGDAIVEIARRDGHVMIRPRHPDHDVRTRYAGTPTFPPSTDWVARGKFVRFGEPRKITVGATVEGLTHVYESPGEVAFELGGPVLRLMAFNGEKPNELFIVFADATSGTTTYAACRFLNVDAPDADSEVTLDFNHATNPPCAYTDFATCPLPPASNHLPVRIEAGEKLPLNVK